MLAVGGVATAIGISSPGLSLPSASGGSIRDSPKEVIDQVWHIVYRDYLDSTGSYDVTGWRQLRSNLLSKSYAGSAESYEAIRGMWRASKTLTRVFLIRRSSRRCRLTPQVS